MRWRNVRSIVVFSIVARDSGLRSSLPKPRLQHGAWALSGRIWCESKSGRLGRMISLAEASLRPFFFDAIPDVIDALQTSSRYFTSEHVYCNSIRRSARSLVFQPLSCDHVRYHILVTMYREAILYLHDAEARSRHARSESIQRSALSDLRYPSPALSASQAS